MEDTVELGSQNYPSLLRELFRGFSEDQRTGMRGVNEVVRNGIVFEEDVYI